MVSNAELHKLITQFQDEFKASNKVFNEKIDTFSERLDNLDHRLDRIDETNLSHARKLEEIDEKIEEVDAKATESLTSVINRLSEVEAQLQRVQIDDLPAQIRQLRSENEKLKEELENRTTRQLWRTLIFKNINETKEDETYSEVKALLTDVVSSYTDIPK